MRGDARVARQVGQALRRLRFERDIAMKVVASRSGVTTTLLSRYENGHLCPSLPNLVRVLKALDCSAEEFGKRLGPWGIICA